MPVRFRKKSATSFLGWVNLPASDRPIRHESTLERDFLHCSPFLNTLVRIEEQPVHIEGSQHSYTPDFAMEFRISANREVGYEFTHLTEVKPFGVLRRDWKELEPRIMLGLEYARERDMNFKILTEREIRDVDLVPMQFLRRFLRVKPDQCFLSWLLELLEKHPATMLDTLRTAKRHLGIEAITGLPTLWHMLATRAIYISDPPTLRYQSLLCHPGSIKGKIWIPGQQIENILLAPWELRP